ncbi:hypothetical protein BDB01DRAFT_295083 [Pilobolus umbonatus]|nr:hypothetical protein BDB01DRAFT_295083 [Pilobolus umbonatus]
MHESGNDTFSIPFGSCVCRFLVFCRRVFNQNASISMQVYIYIQPKKKRIFIYFILDINGDCLSSGHPLYKLVSDLWYKSNKYSDKKCKTSTIMIYFTDPFFATDRFPSFLIKLNCPCWNSFDPNLHRIHHTLSHLVPQFLTSIHAYANPPPLIKKETRYLTRPHPYLSHMSPSLMLSYPHPTIRPKPGPTQPYTLSKHDLHHATLVTQLDRKYILVHHTRTLLFIDQHAADERIRLESLQSQVATRTLSSPLVLPLDEPLTARSMSVLSQWGFRLRVTQDQVWVTVVPEVIADKCHLLRPMLFKAQESRTCPFIDILKSKACRGAVMFNDPLTISQCQSILQKLSTCTYPFQCAHGRPSVFPVQLPTYSIPKRTIHWHRWMK